MHLKLSDVLCLQKIRVYETPNSGCWGMQRVRAEAHLQAAGETLCSFTWGYDDAPSQQETVTEDGPVPVGAPQE